MFGVGCCCLLKGPLVLLRISSNFSVSFPSTERDGQVPRQLWSLLYRGGCALSHALANQAAAFLQGFRVGCGLKTPPMTVGRRQLSALNRPSSEFASCLRALTATKRGRSPEE